MKLSELKALAESATCGPWEFLEENTRFLQRGSVVVEDTHEKELIQLFIPCAVGNILQPELCVIKAMINARFIAAANPQTVLELIERIQGLSEAIKDLSEHGPRCFCDCMEYKSIGNEALYQFGPERELK